MEKLIAKLFVAAAMITLVSCSSEEVIPKPYSDAFIVTENVSGVNLYRMAFYTYANVSMSSVVVESESGETFSLKSPSGYTYEYYLETLNNSEFSEIGEYSFTVTPDKGDVVTNSDVVLNEAIEPIEMTKCAFSTTNNRIEVTWDPSEDVDYAVLILRDANENAVYYSSALSATASSAYITSSGWSNGYAPVDGITYSVELNVFQLEGSTSDFLQSKAITSQDVVWGQE
ncbi:hypothetical protein [Mangrovibacterium lignilyticum]|uniref:hypothetical protein n=1 Tax=Mangrovibacterium lignilyticum TaxID=2668052 RepID=UPI0013D2A1FD|nr:hypothetical protein [Mangrovibacterium lignilyticum]